MCSNPPSISNAANGAQKWVSPDLIFSSSYHCVLGIPSELQKPSRNAGLGQRGSTAQHSFSEVQNYAVWKATRKTCGPMSGSEHIENINSHFLSYGLILSMWMGRKKKETTTSVSLKQPCCILPSPAPRPQLFEFGSPGDPFPEFCEDCRQKWSPET